MREVYDLTKIQSPLQINVNNHDIFEFGSGSKFKDLSIWPSFPELNKFGHVDLNNKKLYW